MHRAVGPALVALALTGARPAFADESGAVGRFGIVTALRANLGELGQSYRRGLLFGLHAGIDQPLAGDSPWSIGLGWTSLVRGYYFASDTALVDQTVETTEVDLGFRLKRSVGLEGGRYIVGTLGGLLSTTNVPLPPKDERRYLGVYGGLGYERRIGGEWSLNVEGRYGNQVDGPQNVSLLLGLIAGVGN